MSQFTVIRNNIVLDVFAADAAFMKEHYDADTVIEGVYPIGWINEDGTLRNPSSITLDPTKFLDTTGYNPVFAGPTLPLTNVAISAPASLVGAIYWLRKDTLATVTANVGLPDDDYMIMAERVINGSTVVDDVRFKATVVGGVISMPVNFPIPGNYLISATRLNEGLDRIGAGVHLSFDSVEFDIYV